MDLPTFAFTRTGTNDPIVDLDEDCAGEVPSSFYGIYGEYGSGSSPSVTYNHNICEIDVDNPTTTGICPHADQTTFCPCLSLDDLNQTCSTLGCSTVSEDDKCETFSSLMIAQCFCTESLQSIITQASSASDLVEKLRAAVTTDPCRDFYTAFLSAILFGYVAIGVTVMVNFLVKAYIFVSASAECHDSTDKMHASLVSKLFFSTYLNLVFVVMIAFARYDMVPDFVKEYDILQGQFSDFDSQWYAVVGTYYIMSFITEFLNPVGILLLSYYIISPLQRYFANRAVMLGTSGSIVRQENLDSLQLGPEFNPVPLTSGLLLLTFFSMTFAAGTSRT